MKVLVIGGGIGGLTAALALLRQGIAVEVYERAPAFGEVGAGLMVASNAMSVLDALGVGARLREISPSLERTELCSAAGDSLKRIDVGGFARRYGAPCLCMHRADLHRTLLEALPRDVVHAGAELEAFWETGTGVEARLTDGRQVTGDVLIGADGLNSRIRAVLHGEEAPAYAGYVCWRGIVPAAGDLVPPGYLFETWGRGDRWGAVHIGNDRVYWFACANGPRGLDYGEETRARLWARFGAYHAPVPELLARTPADGIIVNDIADREPRADWGRGAISLLGDAAHPMTPNLGQGACQAIEDAWVLAQTLAEGGAASDLLRRYELRRYRRTAMMQRRSRTFGRVARWRNPLASALRYLIMKATPDFLADRSYRGYFAFKLDGNAAI